MLFDIESVANEWKTKYNIPDAEVANMVKEAKAGFMRQDDYSRKSQELQNDRIAVKAKYNELVEYENSVRALEQTYGPREQWNEAFAKAVGDQNPGGGGLPASGMTLADVQRIVDARVADALAKQEQDFAGRLETVGQGAASFAEFYFEANEHWKSTYGTPVPKEEFKKFFVENGHTNPKTALALFEQPFKEKKTNEEWEKKLADATREGELRGRSQAGVPGDMGAGVGGWFGGATSIGAAAGSNAIGPTAAPVAGVAPSGEGELTREQKVAKFTAAMDKRAAAGEFTAASS